MVSCLEEKWLNKLCVHGCPKHFGKLNVNESKTYGLRFLEYTCNFKRNGFVPKHSVLLNFLSGLQVLPWFLEGASLAWYFQADDVNFLETITSFLPPVGRFWGGVSPHETTLSFSVILSLNDGSPPPPPWKLRGSKDFPYFLEKGSPP